MTIVQATAADRMLQRAYLAGIIDGEGHVGLHNNGSFQFLVPRLEIYQKNHWFLTSILDRYPQGRIMAHQAGTWTLVYSNPHAIALILTETLPFLVIKQEVAEVVLAISRIAISRPPHSPYSDKEKLLRLTLERMYERRLSELRQMAVLVPELDNEDNCRS